MTKLRIISGEFGGRLINTPQGLTTHPMGDRERSALFNSLHQDLLAKTVLDAFAGSGAIGIEALSRGAKSAVFLEKDAKALQALKANIAELKLSERSKIVSKKDQLKRCKFDIIFADPPYDNPQMGLIDEILKQHLSANGIFVLSHAKSRPVGALEGFKLVFDKTYAAAQIKIYRKL